jgi:hypothetical protein
MRAVLGDGGADETSVIADGRLRVSAAEGVRNDLQSHCA